VYFWSDAPHTGGSGWEVWYDGWINLNSPIIRGLNLTNPVESGQHTASVWGSSHREETSPAIIWMYSCLVLQQYPSFRVSIAECGTLLTCFILWTHKRCWWNI